MLKKTFCFTKIVNDVLLFCRVDVYLKKTSTMFLWFTVKSSYEKASWIVHENSFRKRSQRKKKQPINHRDRANERQMRKKAIDFRESTFIGKIASAKWVNAFHRISITGTRSRNNGVKVIWAKHNAPKRNARFFSGSRVDLTWKVVIFIPIIY